MAITWKFFVKSGQILFQIPDLTIHFDILVKKNTGHFILGDLTWNRPPVNGCCLRFGQKCLSC